MQSSSLPTVALTKPILLFSGDSDSRCILLNNIVIFPTYFRNPGQSNASL